MPGPDSGDRHFDRRRAAAHEARNGVVIGVGQRVERGVDRRRVSDASRAGSADVARTHADPRAGTPCRCAIASTARRIRRRHDDAALRLAEEQRAQGSGRQRRQVDLARRRGASRSMIAHSASATASPPSLQSCAERTAPAAIASSSASMSARSRCEVAARRRAGDHAVDRAQVLAAAELVRRSRRAARSRRRASRKVGRASRGRAIVDETDHARSTGVGYTAPVGLSL